jgi:hypothetical protein
MRDERAGEGEGGGPRPFRRRVFYIPGYDPFPPRRYRELYRREGAAQARLSGYDLAIRPRKGEGFGWHVAMRIGAAPAEAEVEVLVWSDLVQASMGGGVLASHARLARTAAAYIGTGALFRLVRLRKGPVIAAFYPVAVLLAQLALALAAGWLASRALSLALPGGGPWGTLARIAAGGGVALLALEAFRRLDRRLMAWYLLHDYAFTASRLGADPPELTARLAAFRARVAAALREEWDEVLLVGHSSGAHLGVTVLAGVLREGLPPGPRPALAFLTLGQVVPMASFLPRARALRADLRALSVSDALTWVDVSAPGDGCSFALCDPVAVSGAAGPGKRWPLVLSAAFSQTLRPETWKALKRRYFRVHFQYLCAFDNLPGKPWDYDYFRLTAGPRPLSAHFAGRPPSPGRIERALMPPVPA